MLTVVLGKLLRLGEAPSQEELWVVVSLILELQIDDTLTLISDSDPIVRAAFAKCLLFNRVANIQDKTSVMYAPGYIIKGRITPVFAKLSWCGGDDMLDALTPIIESLWNCEGTRRSIRELIDLHANMKGLRGNQIQLFDPILNANPKTLALRG